MKMIYRILLLVLIGSMAVETGFAQQTEKTRPSCENHGGPVAAEVYWLIATKRSGCTRGIGFRCGWHGWILCADQTLYSFKKDGKLGDFDPNRIGNASLAFDLKENAVTFTMLKPLPNEKEDDPLVFTVDEDVVMEIPTPVYLEKQLLQGLVIKKGEYKISYENSKYGEVTFEADIKL